MRLLTKVFLLALVANSGLAFAAEVTSETFSKKIASTGKWDQLLTGFRDSLNPLVLKELTALTQDADFPKMRVQTGRLLISNENGEYLTVVFFQKDGAVTFNGKEWKIQPLATPEAEVKRITEILTTRSALLDFVVPSAFAGGMSMTKGVAAAAYASAAAWKGLNCAMPQLSDEALRTCPLMAVGMQSLTPMNPNIPITQDTRFPTNLKCPAENNGKLELILRKINGKATRLEVSYKADIPTSITIFEKDSASPFVERIRVTPEEPVSSEHQSAIRWAKLQSEVLVEEVCKSEESRKRFKDLATANSVQLNKTSSNEDGSGTNRSSTGL